MTIFMIAAAVLLVLGFFLNGRLVDEFAFFAITPTENYGDPSSYVGKKVLMETTFDGGTIQASGTVVEGNGDIYADITDGQSNPMGTLNFKSGRLVFMAHGLTVGQELTVKVSIAEEGSGSGAGGLVVHDNNGTLDKMWQEIHAAMASGRSVVIDAGDGIETFVVLGTSEDANGYIVIVATTSDRRTYNASSPDDYPGTIDDSPDE